MQRWRVTNKKRVALLALFVALLGGLAWLLTLAPDWLFHGKPESEWIKGIAYGMSMSDAENQEQVKRWREFGPDGVRVLARAVENADHPIQRIYRKMHRQISKLLPAFLMRFLPTPGPMVTGGPPSNVLDLLSRLGKDADPAAPAVARALKSDDVGVRNAAINFFIWGEGESCLLNRMKAKEKRKLLPDFIRAVEDTGANWSPRNNATIALKYYPERREVVAPVLVKALQDPVPKVRMCAAESLYRIAPDLITKAGVVPVVIGVLKNPDDQIAWRAASLLGQMRIDPALAVPALIESLENKSSLVASTAAQALAGFKGQAETIIPALEKATRREDTAGGWAKNALKQLESEPQSDQGSRK